MSEPTYRVQLQGRPTAPGELWTADIYHTADGEYLTSQVGRTREEAFDAAQTWIRSLVAASEPYNVWLDEDGEIMDRHEAGVLRDANA